jgi:hypothetical protein
MCKYEDLGGYETPCVACYTPEDEKPTHFEPKCDCQTCEYGNRKSYQEPCNYCEILENDIPSEWTAKEEVKAPTIPPFKQSSTVPNSDPTNHPTHYNTGKYECWDVMEEVFGVEALKTFCLLCIFKYSYRSEHKNGIEDIKKIVNYAQKYIELSERQE